MESNLCACGCGQSTSFATKTSKKQGYVKGQPMQYVSGHNARLQVDGSNRNKLVNKRGYVRVYSPNNSRVDNQGYVREHILVVEKALGKQLPPKAVVHHIDGNPSNNESSNLVICQDQEYHFLIHKRTRALKRNNTPVTF